MSPAAVVIGALRLKCLVAGSAMQYKLKQNNKWGPIPVRGDPISMSYIIQRGKLVNETLF